MSTPVYREIPNPKQFKHDSSVTLAVRSEDIILTHLDWLLERYQVRNTAESDSVRRAILCDLFMTANSWIKSYKDGNKRMLKERYPAVLALFEAVVNALCAVLRCSTTALPQVLAEIYGRDMHTKGLQTDEQQGRAKYLDKIERQVYRLRFKGGLAFQYPFWRGENPSVLQKAESKKAYESLARKGDDGKMVETSKNFGVFVMTMQREFYMGKPEVGAPGSLAGIFHSSFTGGDVVTMAGTMLIEKGKILGIRTDSGHYQPEQMNMALMLQALAMYKVDLSVIQLYHWDGTELGSALEFLKSKMTWEEFDKHRRKERKHRAESDEYRKQLGLDPKFPKLPGKAPAVPQRPGTPPPLPPRPNQTPLVSQQQDNSGFYANNPNPPMPPSQPVADVYATRR